MRVLVRAFSPRIPMRPLRVFIALAASLFALGVIRAHADIITLSSGSVASGFRVASN